MEQLRALDNNIKIKDFGPALRLAITYSGASAGGIFDVVAARGQDQVLTRIGKVTS